MEKTERMQLEKAKEPEVKDRSIPCMAAIACILAIAAVILATTRHPLATFFFLIGAGFFAACSWCEYTDNF